MKRAFIVAFCVFGWSSPAPAQEAHADGPDPDVCQVVPAPPAEALGPYVKNGPYAKGVRYLLKGRYREAAREMMGAWRKVRADLATAFSTSTCEPARIRAVLSRTLFHSPPLVAPGDDRFLPPPVIREAMAHALCVTGRTREAADLLWEAAMGGDNEARAPAGVLFAASGRSDLCLALCPETPADPVATLARAYCLLQAGRLAEAQSLAARAGPARGPRMEVLLRLVRSVTSPESPRHNPEAP